MNIGNLIKNKMNISSFCNVKELYEAMKDIVGDECCAYSTFADSINKNKGLSSSELLTLAVLLDIDLNLLAMHYVNTQSSLKNAVYTAEDYNELEKNVLNVLNIFAYNSMTGCRFEKSDIIFVNSKVCAFAMDHRGDTVLAYEVAIKKRGSKYTFRISTIANFNYFKSILKNSDTSLEEFKEMNLIDKFDFAKDASKLYYEMFPEMKVEDKTIDFEEFKEDMLQEHIRQYLEGNKNDLNLDKDGEIYGESWDRLDNRILKMIVNESIDYKYHIDNFFNQDDEYIGGLFRKMATEVLYKNEKWRILQRVRESIELSVNKSCKDDEEIEINEVKIGDIFKSVKYNVEKKVYETEGYYILDELEELDDSENILLIKCDEDGNYNYFEFDEYEDVQKLISKGDLDLITQRLNLRPVKY